MKVIKLNSKAVSAAMACPYVYGRSNKIIREVGRIFTRLIKRELQLEQNKNGEVTVFVGAVCKMAVILWCNLSAGEVGMAKRGARDEGLACARSQ